MKYSFDEFIERKHDKYSFSCKWQGPEYILDAVGVKDVREDIICLETADMDFKVASEILEDLHRLTDHGILGYSLITEAYREAVVGWYEKRQNWHFEKDDIFYCPGTHTAVAELVKCYTKEGEGVIVLTPCYGYHSDVDANGRKYISVEMINDGNEYFTIDYDALETACKDPNNTMIIVCHPQNPTGRVYNHEELNRIADLCRKNGVLIVSDEVHSDILRKGQEFEPMMKAVGTEGMIACTAVNKTFNLAGLAMTNVVICDPELKEKFKYNILPSPYGVQAVISAYTKCEDWVDELNEYLDKTIDECVAYVEKNLPKAKIWKPEGGYSINIDFSGYGLSDEEVVEKIYKKAGVVMNSGLFFDDKRGKQVHRACLSSPLSLCLEALERVALEFKNN